MVDLTEALHNSEDPPLVKNAGDKEQVRKASKKERYAKINRINDTRFVLSDERGRRFVWGLMERCFSQTFDSENSRLDAFRSGERNMSLKLLREITDADPDAFVTMLKEAQDKKKKEG